MSGGEDGKWVDELTDHRSRSTRVARAEGRERAVAAKEKHLVYILIFEKSVVARKVTFVAGVCEPKIFEFGIEEVDVQSPICVESE